MTNPIKRYFYLKAMRALSKICIGMRQEGYDRKTLSEVIDRVEHTLFPEEFKK